MNIVEAFALLLDRHYEKVLHGAERVGRLAPLKFVYQLLGIFPFPQTELGKQVLLGLASRFDTADKAIVNLYSTNNHRRHAAQIALGQLGTPAATAALLDELDQNPWLVTDIMAYALSLSGEKIVPSLMARLYPPVSPRRYTIIFEALRHLGYRSERKLEAMTTELGQHLRRFMIAWQNASPSVSPRRLMYHPEQDRLRLLEIISGAKTREAVPAVCDLLFDFSASIRIRACTTLGALRDTRALPHLTTALLHQPDLLIAAASAIALTSGHQNLRTMNQALISENRNITLTAIQMMGTIRDEYAEVALLRVLEANHLPYVELIRLQQAAIEGLRQVTSPRAQQAVQLWESVHKF